MKKVEITWEQVFDALKEVDRYKEVIYGVPTGGMVAAGFLRFARITHNPFLATIILDDIVDSGKTREYYLDRCPRTQFRSLFTKCSSLHWFVFPWERDHPSGEKSIEDNIVRQIQYLGEDSTRDGLKDTPRRIVQSWKEIFAGYSMDPSKLFTIFESENYDSMVLLKDIELYSTCEHHMLPFFGKAHVAYIPSDGRIVGISKLARLVDLYARRLQIQERICEQVTRALMEYLKPKGAACIIEATHMCMCMRGVTKQNSVMVTSSLKGEFMSDPTVRQELMNLI